MDNRRLWLYGVEHVDDGWQRFVLHGNTPYGFCGGGGILCRHCRDDFASMSRFVPGKQLLVGKFAAKAGYGGVIGRQYGDNPRHLLRGTRVDRENAGMGMVAEQ